MTLYTCLQVFPGLCVIPSGIVLASLMKYGVLSAFENCDNNSIIPLNNVITMLLTAQQTIHDQNVLVTVPLIV